MSIAEKQAPQSIEETNRKLRILDLEWQERKAERLEKALHEAADPLRGRLAAVEDLSVETADRCLIIRIGEDRVIRLSLRLHLEEKGSDCDYRVQDKQIRRCPDYEEVDNEHIFETIDQATSHIIGQCE